VDYSVESSSLAGALDSLWYRFLPEMESRVETLISAAEAAQSGPLSSEQREEAHSAAHKLAGVLGTFGLSRGTALARELERLFLEQTEWRPIAAERLLADAAELRVIVGGRK